MSVNELVSAIPQIMLYIVPGFIVVKITETYTPRKKTPQYETVLWSIFYSFIVLSIYAVGSGLFHKIYPCLHAKGISISVSQEVRYLLYYVLSGFVGFIVTKLYNSKLGEFLTKRLNTNMAPDEDVWFAALRSNEVAWVRVYLKNGYIYTGALTKFTSNPNDTNRLIELSNFSLMLRTHYPENNEPQESFFSKWLGKKDKAKDFCEVIDTYTTDNKARVLLKYEDIVSIEFVTNPEHH